MLRTCLVLNTAPRGQAPAVAKNTGIAMSTSMGDTIVFGRGSHYRNGKPMTAPLRIGLCFSVVCSVAISARSEGEGTGPKRLLPEALELARGLPDGKGYGNWAKPLAVLRIASTMRLAGMNDEALAAFEECAAMNSRLSEEAIKDEIVRKAHPHNPRGR